MKTLCRKCYAIIKKRDAIEITRAQLEHMRHKDDPQEQLYSFPIDYEYRYVRVCVDCLKKGDERYE
jgi:hypothetical protein